MRFSLLSVWDVSLLKGFLWTRRQLGNGAHCGHPANLLRKCNRSFPECPQYIYSIGHYNRESGVVILNWSLLCHLIQHFWKDLGAQAHKKCPTRSDRWSVWSCILPLTQMGDIVQVVSPDIFCGPFPAYTPSMQNCCVGGVGEYQVLLILIYGHVVCACVGSCSTVAQLKSDYMSENTWKLRVRFATNTVH